MTTFLVHIPNNRGGYNSEKRPDDYPYVFKKDRLDTAYIALTQSEALMSIGYLRAKHPPPGSA